ncbi:unnamed protein product [Ranitomeya imitator]|uniref:Uncharacterized protein n=1 Tax=Ranitomeya imitator TaxID=111125 RepID=A0ABN9KNR3_9NEOB|nr:unnamed protein product [Ranitomeya imitator]
MDLDKLETWAERWQMRFNNDKCKVIHMGRGNQYHHYTLNGKPLGKSDREKDLGILVNDKLTWSSQCQAAAAKANRIMGKTDVVNNDNLGGMDYPCQPPYEGARSSMACTWSLAEAQQKLTSLALHNSESIDQEHAKAQAEVSELQRSEQEWKQKEAALPLGENWGMSSSDAFSQDVFNKSFINRAKSQEDKDESLSFIQKYEIKIRHFACLFCFAGSSETQRVYCRAVSSARLE